jgi:hypothetical protein
MPVTSGAINQSGFDGRTPSRELSNISTLGNNVFVGQSAGNKNANQTAGNIFMGYFTGSSNVVGAQNTFIGYESGRKNSQASRNVFLGYQSGYNNSNGNDNVFLGNQTGYTSTSGNSNVFIGNKTGFNNISGNNNVFLGTNVGENNLNGSSNVFIGNLTGQNNKQGNGNVFIGDKTGRSNLNGKENVFIGKSCGEENTDGSYNVFLGFESGKKSQGNYNLFLGYKAGINNNGDNNIVISVNKESDAPTSFGGSNNTIQGVDAGKNNNGNNNVLLGFETGKNNNGNENVLLGYKTGKDNTGSTNTFLGTNTGILNQGNNNVLVGAYNETNNTSNNIFIGNNLTSTHSNVVLIGNKASSNGENGIAIGTLENENVVAQENSINMNNIIKVGENFALLGNIATIESSNVILGENNLVHVRPTDVQLGNVASVQPNDVQLGGVVQATNNTVLLGNDSDRIVSISTTDTETATGSLVNIRSSNVILGENNLVHVQPNDVQLGNVASVQPNDVRLGNVARMQPNDVQLGGVVQATNNTVLLGNDSDRIVSISTTDTETATGSLVNIRSSNVILGENNLVQVQPNDVQLGNVARMQPNDVQLGSVVQATNNTVLLGNDSNRIVSISTTDTETATGSLVNIRSSNVILGENNLVQVQPNDVQLGNVARMQPNDVQLGSVVQATNNTVLLGNDSNVPIVSISSSGETVTTGTLVNVRTNEVQLGGVVEVTNNNIILGGELDNNLLESITGVDDLPDANDEIARLKIGKVDKHFLSPSDDTSGRLLDITTNRVFLGGYGTSNYNVVGIDCSESSTNITMGLGTRIESGSVNSTAIGHLAAVNGNNSISIGNNHITGDDTIVLGSNNEWLGAASIIIGNNRNTVNEDDEIEILNNRIIIGNDIDVDQPQYVQIGNIFKGDENKIQCGIPDDEFDASEYEDSGDLILIKRGQTGIFSSDSANNPTPDINMYNTSSCAVGRKPVTSAGSSKPFSEPVTGILPLIKIAQFRNSRATFVRLGPSTYDGTYLIDCREARTFDLDPSKDQSDPNDWTLGTGETVLKINGDQIYPLENRTIISSSEDGIPGQMKVNSSYLYICVTSYSEVIWKKIPLQNI